MADVDLNRYREPSRDPAVLAARRAALTQQLGWLRDEAEALGPLLTALPAWAVEQTPTADERSVKETLAVLAALDRTVYPGWIAGLIADPERVPYLELPDLTALAEGANDRSLADLLAEVARDRESLMQAVEALGDHLWSARLVLDGTQTDVYGLLLTVVQRDADELRTLAYRLHSADLSQRGQ